MRAKIIGNGAALAVIASLFCANAMAQSVSNAGFHVTPARAESVQLRRVAAPSDGRLVYEYQNGAGVSRVAIDPTTLVNDIERARKRAPKKSAKNAAPAAAAPMAKPEIAQAELETAVAVSPEPQERKVRVIQLYNVPKAD